MRKEMLDILACPICRSSLLLEVETEESENVITGTLNCTECNEIYYIEGEVPNLLPPNLRSI